MRGGLNLSLSRTQDGSLIAGARYVRHAPPVRRMLLRILLFVAPGAALWALLPLVASQLLGLDATGYGLLLAALGIGAVSGAVVLPHLAARVSASQLILTAGLVPPPPPPYARWCPTPWSWCSCCCRPGWPG